MPCTIFDEVLPGTNKVWEMGGGWSIRWGGKPLIYTHVERGGLLEYPKQREE